MKTEIYYSEYAQERKNYAMESLRKVLESDDYKNSSIFIISDVNTVEQCLPIVRYHVNRVKISKLFTVPAGEEAKELETAYYLYKALIEEGADSKSVLINLGGGCVSDLGGFVAASFKRGIRYFNIPTTIVGMVDASIGGKTAVNIGNIKNQVGFFYPPEAVFIDIRFLNTTSEGSRLAGYFEMLKTFLLSDVKMVELFESFLQAKLVKNEEIALYSFVKHCVDFKADVVNADPTDKSIRRILNFGHTFGHGYESFLLEKGTPIDHGIAVGIGMICELYLSVKKLGLNEKVLTDYISLIKSLVRFPKLALKDAETILSFMRKDKKNRDGLILCTLLQDVGVPVIDVAIDENEVRDALLQLRKL